MAILSSLIRFNLSRFSPAKCIYRLHTVFASSATAFPHHTNIQKKKGGELKHKIYTPNFSVLSARRNNENVKCSY